MPHAIHKFKGKRSSVYNSSYSIDFPGEPKNGQDYDRIKSVCLARNQLFTDPLFPPSSVSLYGPKHNGKKRTWKRPHQITESPKMFGDGGAQRWDVKQGEHHDSSFLSAVAALTIYPELLEFVIPGGQSFDPPDYCGIFRFRFWRFGKWVEVVIDDYLPMSKKEHNRPFSVHSTSPEIFWSALLEKAYAKFNGYYKMLGSGKLLYALEDLTGGVPELIRLKKTLDSQYIHKTLLPIFRHCYLMKSVMVTAVNPKIVKDVILGPFFNHQLRNGLYRRHGYSVTCVDTVHTIHGEDIPVLRVRNPWDKEKQWNGPWSYTSEEWDKVSEEEKKRFDFDQHETGEFWMSLDDFCRSFSKVVICHMSPDTMMTRSHLRWNMVTFRGSWKKGVNSGGNCYSCPFTYFYNPQYVFHVADCRTWENLSTWVSGCTVIVSLMVEKESSQRLQCCIYLIRRPYNETRPLNIRFFDENEPLHRKVMSSRECLLRVNLDHGVYVIIPSITRDKEAEYKLRILSEVPLEVEEYDQAIQMASPQLDISELAMPRPLLEENFRKLVGDNMVMHPTGLYNLMNFATATYAGRFTFEESRSVFATYDSNLDGVLNLEEFDTFWRCIKVCRRAFVEADVRTVEGRKKYFLTKYDLREALKLTGIEVNREVLTSLALRYGGDFQVLSFEDFFLCYSRLRHLMKAFDPSVDEPPQQRRLASTSQRTQAADTVSLSRDEYLELLLYS